MTPQVTQSSDGDQHHTMTSTSEGPGPRGQVNATRKVKADTMHQWSEQQSSGLQCPYLDMAPWQNEEGATLSTMCNTHTAHTTRCHSLANHTTAYLPPALATLVHTPCTHTHNEMAAVYKASMDTRLLPHLLTCTQGHRPLTIRCSTGRGSQVKRLD